MKKLSWRSVALTPQVNEDTKETVKNFLLENESVMH